MDETYTVTRKMIAYFAGDPKRIQHFLKVHAYAQLIAKGEGLAGSTRTILEIASLVHDIGIKPAEEQYGRSDGKLQEQLGPDAARELLSDLCDGKTLDRIAWLIAHHHTYTDVTDIDLRILMEADALTNLAEEHASNKTIRACYERVFRTATGRALCETVFAQAF